MKTIVKTITVLVGVFILANGVMFMFKPEFVMGHSAISANNAFGMSTIRGLIGGSMLATSLMILVAIIKNKLELLHPASWVLLGWTFGRVVSLVTDGFDSNVLSGGIVISLIMAIILIFSFKTLSKTS